MKFGHFDDEKKEYIIHTPKTPLPWINYLGSDAFFTLVSNTAGGYSFYKDARLRRITRYRYNACPLDADGFHVYIRDGEAIWNPGWQPTQTELDKYECRHGLGYTIITGEKNGIKATQEMLVPNGDNCLLVRISVENVSKGDKKISLFPYTEFCLWDAMDDSSNFQRNYSIGEVELIENAIIHKTEYRERRDHYSILWSNEKIDGFDTARDAFIGVYGSPALPEAVKEGTCKNSVASGWQVVGAMQFDINLKSGEKKNILLGLGYIENPDEKWEGKNLVNKKKAYEMINRYVKTESFDNEMKKLSEKWTDLLSTYRIESEDEKLNRSINIWNQYQCMVTFNMSRSASYFESGMGRGMGFRDSCQDLFGFVHMVPERARERILDIAATQFEDGQAYHQYQPLTKRGNLAVGSGFNDDPLWLIACTDAYIRETGDFAILDEMVPFDNNEKLAQPLMEHLRRSFHYIVTNLGPHGLPLIGRADWNDCLNLNCFSEHPGESFQTTGPSEGPIAESIFIAGMVVKFGKAYASICSHIGLKDEAEKCLKTIDEMKKSVLAYGWDGNWFIRAYDAFSNPVGSKSCDEGKIFIEPQGMCVMAGIGIETGEAQEAMNSVEKYLDTKYGVVLLDPPFTYYKLNLGEVTSYLPSYKENGSVFCHSNSWIINGETELKHGTRAFELYARICPAYIEEISDIHRTEPYVYSQTIAGKDAAIPGEAKNSWLSGTSACMFQAISQSILGIKPELDGLMVDPCIPSTWKEYQVTRRFRGGVYRIKVQNPSGIESGVKSIMYNGKKLEGQILPLLKRGESAEVIVTMG